MEFSAASAMLATARAGIQRMDSPGGVGVGGQYLTFQVAGQTYAMRIATIKEIIEYGALTSIPLMPSFIRGVINLRGAVVPVIDLGRAWASPPLRQAVAPAS